MRAISDRAYARSGEPPALPKPSVSAALGADVRPLRGSSTGGAASTTVAPGAIGGDKLFRRVVRRTGTAARAAVLSHIPVGVERHGVIEIIPEVHLGNMGSPGIDLSADRRCDLLR